MFNSFFVGGAKLSNEVHYDSLFLRVFNQPHLAVLYVQKKKKNVI